MNGDQTESSNRTAVRSRSKAPKMDQARALEFAVMDYKKDANDKNWSNIEKILQALTKTSHAKLLCSCPALLMDLQWILTVNRKKEQPITVALNMLTKLCSMDTSISTFLRDKIRIHATLTNLLIQVPLTNHQKCAKILDLLRHVTINIKLQRQESFLQDLIARLFQHINDKEEKPKNVSLSLTVLTNLCHHNYSVTTFVLSLISQEERKELIAKHNDDPVLQVLLLRFNFCLTQANLSSQFRDIKIGYYVTQILDAVCHVYNEEDNILLQTFCDFLKDLSNESRYRDDLVKSITLEFIQQIFLVLDYSQGSNHANELIFRFAREAMSLCAGDINSLLEIVVRTVAARLENNLNATKLSGFTDCYEAIMLLNEVIRIFNIKMEIKNENSGEQATTPQTHNVKLQLEQITPVLCSLFDLKYLTEINMASEDEIEQLDQLLNTYCAILITLSTVAEKDEWVEIICKQIKNPADVFCQIKLVINRASVDTRQNTFYALYKKCSVPIITEMIHLCVILGSSFKQYWSEACQNLVSDEEVVSDVDFCMKKGCHSAEIGKLLNYLAEGKQMPLFTKALAKNNQNLQNSFDDQSAGAMRSHFQTMKQNQLMVESASQALSQPQTDIKICEVMENITNALPNSHMDETLADIFDLNEYRLAAHKRQIDALKASLKAADQRITESEMINVNLETEVAKLNCVTKNLLRKIEVTGKELKEIKTQYHDSQNDNTEFRQNLLKDLEEKSKTIDSLEEEKSKAIDKLHQYKERMINMKNTIEDLEKSNLELNGKYEEEVKQKTDLQTTLTKREEKLKRKEKQILEESEIKEKQAKDLETTRQELGSLKQLTKRQEQALTKKEKQIQEQAEEINSVKTIQEQIFSLAGKTKK